MPCPSKDRFSTRRGGKAFVYELGLGPDFCSDVSASATMKWVQKKSFIIVSDQTATLPSQTPLPSSIFSARTPVRPTVQKQSWFKCEFPLDSAVFSFQLFRYELNRIVLPFLQDHSILTFLSPFFPFMWSYHFLNGLSLLILKPSNKSKFLDSIL